MNIQAGDMVIIDVLKEHFSFAIQRNERFLRLPNGLDGKMIHGNKQTAIDVLDLVAAITSCKPGDIIESPNCYSFTVSPSKSEEIKEGKNGRIFCKLIPF